MFAPRTNVFMTKYQNLDAICLVPPTIVSCDLMSYRDMFHNSDKVSPHSCLQLRISEMKEKEILYVSAGRV